MRPLPSKIRQRIIAFAALGLCWGNVDPVSAASLQYERILTPQASDGTPYEEPEVTPELPNDPGGIGQPAGGNKPKNPHEPLDKAAPWLAPLRHVVRWVVQIRWIS